MSDKKFPRATGTTPKGRASWPRLDTPDTKYKEGGLYSTKLILTGPDAEGLIAQIDKVADETYEMAKEQINAAKAKEKNPKKRAEIKERAEPAYREVYGEGDVPTGEYEFNFKMLASGTSKKTGKPWTRKPAVFDAKGKPILDVAGAKIGGGSVIRVNYAIDGFYTAGLGAGVSLKLEAVQVIECRSFGDRTAAGFGFGEEDGFEAEDQPKNAHGFTNEAPTGEPNASDDF